METAWDRAVRPPLVALRDRAHEDPRLRNLIQRVRTVTAPPVRQAFVNAAMPPTTPRPPPDRPPRIVAAPWATASAAPRAADGPAHDPRSRPPPRAPDARKRPASNTDSAW